jgi:hypothetical protein
MSYRSSGQVASRSQDRPATGWANAGTELLQPTAGNNSSYENYLRAENQAQDEVCGAIDAQRPGITTNGDNDAGTGEDDNGG